MSKKQSHQTKSDGTKPIDQARLEIDRKHLRIEEEKTRLERRLFYKHFGSILAAFVSFGALVVSMGQVYTNKHLGDQQTQLLRDHQQKEFQTQQDQITLTRSLRDMEQETRATDNSLKLAQFLVDNQTELLSSDDTRRKRMESILFAAFDARVIVPVLERLKGIQFSMPTQNRLESLLDKAKELKIQANDTQARNEVLQPSNRSPTLPVEISSENKRAVTVVDETTPRVALVIGNASYEQSPLRNAVNDARGMARTLADLHFEVTYNENVSQKDLRRAIQAFGAKLREKKGVGLFYYAGHGIQVSGTNYLVPVDAKLQNGADVEYEAVNAGFVIAQMDSADNPMNIVILDACRTNSFGGITRSLSQPVKGLAEMSAPVGTLIAYATSPGSVAFDGDEQYGLYTQELLKNMRSPGLSIEEMFKKVRISVRSKSLDKQIPWESSSLVNEFYFVHKNKTTAPQLSSEAADQPTR
jgi:hypothetical protein